MLSTFQAEQDFCNIGTIEQLVQGLNVPGKLRAAARSLHYLFVLSLSVCVAEVASVHPARGILICSRLEHGCPSLWR
jgi:hypothetical protein